MPDFLRLAEASELEQRLTSAACGAQGAALAAELLRMETVAAGEVGASALVARVAAKLAQNNENPAVLEETLELLHSVGDLLIGPRRLVRPAPLRLVDVGTPWWILLGSASVRVILDLVGKGAQVQHGVLRRISFSNPEESVEHIVSETRGTEVSLENWAGLDEVTSPQNYLSELKRRVHCSLSPRLHPETFDIIEHFHGSELFGRPTWKLDPAPGEEMLLRIPRANGFYDYGFGIVQDFNSLLRITKDEARRAAYLLAMEQKNPISCLFSATSQGDAALLFPIPLPIVEYRLVSRLRLPGGADNGKTILIKADDQEWVRDTLTRRLFVSWIDRRSDDASLSESKR